MINIIMSFNNKIHNSRLFELALAINIILFEIQFSDDN